MFVNSPLTAIVSSTFNAFTQTTKFTQITAVHRVPTPPGQSWVFLLKISGPGKWKLLEKHWSWEVKSNFLTRPKQRTAATSRTTERKQFAVPTAERWDRNRRLLGQTK